MPSIFPFVPRILVIGTLDIEVKRAVECASRGGVWTDRQCQENACSNFNRDGGFIVNPGSRDEFKRYLKKYGLMPGAFRTSDDNLINRQPRVIFEITPDGAVKSNTFINVCFNIGFDAEHECNNGYNPYITEEMCKNYGQTAVYAYYKKESVTCGKCDVTCKEGYSIGYTEEECHNHGMKFADGYTSADGLYCGKCVACPTGYAYGITKSECRKVNMRLLEGSDGCNKCANCPSGYTYGLTAKDCDYNQFFSSAAGGCGKCVYCPSGYSSEVSTCPKNQFLASQTTSKCRKCISCPSGYSMNVICQKGKTVVSHQTYPQCQKCM